MTRNSTTRVSLETITKPKRICTTPSQMHGLELGDQQRGGEGAGRQAHAAHHHHHEGRRLW